MKKIIALLACLATIFSLAACGVETSNVNSTPASEAAASTAVSVVEDASTEEASAQNEVEAPAAAEEDEKFPFEEVTVVDNSECSIKVIEIIPDDVWGYTLKVELENKSADKNYMFSVVNGAINGVQSDPFFASSVAAGKKAVEDITFSDSVLDENGIVDFTAIELIFHVYDDDDWTADDVAYETVHIYPYGEESATYFEREPQDTDIVLIDNEYVTVTAIGFEEEGDWGGYTMNLFLVNKTDKELMFSAEDVSVNGYMADPFYASSVMPYKCAFTSMAWDDTTFEECGITSVEDIEFLLSVYDYNDWEADNLVDETILVQP